MPKRKEYDTTIQFKDNDSSLKKAETMYRCLEEEYTLRTEDICDLLLCNRKYIDDYIKPNVTNLFVNSKQMNWIVMTLNLGQSFVTSHRSYYYFSKESFLRYLQNQMICTRQTIRLDLMDYMIEEVKEGSKIYEKVYDQIKEGEYKQAKEYLNPLGRRFYSNALSKVDSTKRNFTSMIEVKNKIEIEDLPLMRAGSNKELFYRHAFVNGYIKVKLNGKSFFINLSYEIATWGITLSYEEYCNLCYEK